MAKAEFWTASLAFDEASATCVVEIRGADPNRVQQSHFETIEAACEALAAAGFIEDSAGSWSATRAWMDSELAGLEVQQSSRLCIDDRPEGQVVPAKPLRFSR